MGQYMLNGWVMTDKICNSNNGECPVPLMSSPKGQAPAIVFCVRCHGGPEGVGAPSAAPSASTSTSTSIASASHISRASTPPTELSNDDSSFEDFVLPPETEESRRRRELVDAASSEIGKRLLKGWAMLSDECPSSECWGVPLVRPPKAGGGKNPLMVSS
ncbi:hypothetical protein HDZ31DRAFT_23018, partial [Schizophyllum fasciatum]